MSHATKDCSFNVAGTVVKEALACKELEFSEFIRIRVNKKYVYRLAYNKKLNKQNNRTLLFAGTESHRTLRLLYKIPPFER